MYKYVLFRFVNIICQLQKNQSASAIWKIMEEVRHINQYQSDIINFCGKTILPINVIQKNNDLLGNQTGIVGDFIPNENISKECLQKAAAMFTYMNLCTGLGDLYRDIFKKSSPKNIILALQSMKRNSDDMNKNITEKIWYFVTRKLNLTTHEQMKYLMDDKFSWKSEIDDNFLNFTKVEMMNES